MDIDEIPIYNWNKCLDGEIQYVRKNEKGNDKLDNIVWEMLYNQYINTFGLGKMYTRLLKVMQKKSLAELDFVITNDRFKLTLIEMEEIKLKNILNNSTKGISIEQSLIYLSKWIGYWLQPKVISVREYFDLLKEYERYNTQANG